MGMGPKRARSEGVEKIYEDLYAARLTILELMPEAQRNIVEKIVYEPLELDTDGRFLTSERRQIKAALAIISLAEVIPHPWDGDRARCPLCKRTPQSAYSVGFTVPEGLRRHLLGENKANQCPVMEAARGLLEMRFDEPSVYGTDPPQEDLELERR